MKKEILSVVGAVLLSIGVHAQISEVVKDSLEERFKEFVNTYKLKGVGVAVHFNDGSVWGIYAHGHYGTERLTPNLLFEAGSNTKTMIAALTLLLEEEGKLSIDDSIGKYIKPTLHVDGKITIKQLLNHSSGVFSFTEHPNYYPTINNNWDKMISVDSVLAYYVNPPLFAPGEKIRYSNTGYLILGKIIEVVQKQDLATVMRHKLYDKNSLNDTYLAFHEQHQNTHLGVWFGNSYDPVPSTSFLSSAWAAGGVICTPKDLSKWAYNLYSGKVLSQESFDKMNQTASWGGDESYGLGMFKRVFNGHTYLGHGGQTLQTSTMDYSVDGEYSLAIMNLGDDKWNETMGLRARMLLLLEDYIPTVEVPEDTQEEVLSLSENYMDLHVSVFPVPSTYVVNIRVENSDSFYYEVVNFQGQILKQDSSENTTIQITKSEIGEGSFWVRIMDSNGQVLVKPIQFQ